jgi:hypothetical protein
MLLLSIVVTLLQLLTSSFAAYSFAKLHSRHKNALFLAYIDHRHALAYLHGAPVHHDADNGSVAPEYTSIVPTDPIPAKVKESTLTQY